MDAQIQELAQRSPNFGFLAAHEPLLVLDGATAESYVYADPDAAMFKARRFGETLARKLVSLTQTRVGGSPTQHDRIRGLSDAGVLVPRIRLRSERRTQPALVSHAVDVRTAPDRLDPYQPRGRIDLRPRGNSGGALAWLPMVRSESR